MRQHRFAGHIANGVDVLIGCAALFVYLDKALLVHLDARLLQADLTAIGPPANRHKDPAEDRLAFGHLCPFERGTNTTARLAQPGDLGAQVDLVKFVLQPFLQGADQVAIYTWQKSVGQFHDGYLAAESGVDVAKLEANIAAAHNEQPFGHFFQFQGGRRVHHARTFQHQGRRDDGARTDRDNTVLEAPARAVLQLQRARVFKAAAAPHIFHLPALAEHCQVLAQGLYNPGALVAQTGQVNLGGTVVHAPRHGIPYIGDQPGHVQEGLGGDTADIQTRAAWFFQAVDERDLHALIGSEESGGVAAGAGAKDD